MFEKFMGYTPPNKGRTATLVVAASNASARSKAGADYVCDGTSDEVEINAAINDLPSGGGKLQLTEGLFTISSAIIINKGIRFSGVGMPTNIFLAAGSNSRMIEIAYATATENKPHPTLEHFYLDGNKANQSSGTEAIKLATSTDYPRDLTVRDVWIESYKGHGISAIQNSGHHHYYTHVSIERCSGAGINAVSTLECNLEDCLLYDNWYGVIVGSVNAKVNINGTRIDANSYEGIKATTYSRLIISNNDISNNGDINSNTYSAIYLNSSNAIITGNRITGSTGKYGIEEGASANNNVIVGNVVTDGVTGKILKTGASSLIQHNLGYVDTGRGTATVADDATSVDVTHGLSKTPVAQDIVITPTSNLGDASLYWISDIGASTFRINIDADPGAGTATFAWQIN